MRNTDFIYIQQTSDTHYTFWVTNKENTKAISVQFDIGYYEKILQEETYGIMRYAILHEYSESEGAQKCGCLFGKTCEYTIPYGGYSARMYSEDFDKAFVKFIKDNDTKDMFYILATMYNKYVDDNNN